MIYESLLKVEGLESETWTANAGVGRTRTVPRTASVLEEIEKNCLAGREGSESNAKWKSSSSHNELKFERTSIDSTRAKRDTHCVGKHDTVVLNEKRENLRGHNGGKQSAPSFNCRPRAKINVATLRQQPQK